MKPNDTLHESADDRHRTTVDTLLEGDAVDKQALRDALSDAEARDYFVDALLLRQLAIDMAPTEFKATGPLRIPTARAFRWTAAAAVAISTAVAGYTLGRQHPPTVAILEGPSVEAHLPSIPAPAPTRTIRFEPGENWISNVEGR